MRDKKRRSRSARDFYLRPIEGPPCPKCGAGDIRYHFSWGAFGISIIALFLSGAVIQWIMPEGTRGGFAVRNLLDAISTFLFICVVWIFFGALLRKNRCNAYGHRWKD